MTIAKKPDEQLPIVIAGGGCVGLFLALLLAQSPLPNRIVVIEPQHPDPSSIRAMAHQPPTFPLFAQIPGLLPELVAAGSLSAGLCFRTSVQNGSRVIASKTFQNDGEGMKGKGQILLPQGKFQKVLMGRLAKTDGRVEVRLGWAVDGFTQSASHVSVRIAPSSGETETQHVDAAYLVGADGAHSLVRKAMGLDLQGETLDAQLVATDLRFPFKDYGFFDANFIVDATNYGHVSRINNDGLWRVSYSVPDTISEEEIRDGVAVKLRGMLPNGGKNEEGEDAFEVMRVAPYRAQQRCVERLVEGRVLLVGDAAHCESSHPVSHVLSGHCVMTMTSADEDSDESLCGPWPCKRHRRRRRPGTSPLAHTRFQSVRRVHPLDFLVRSKETEILRRGRQAESHGVQARSDQGRYRRGCEGIAGKGSDGQGPQERDARHAAEFKECRGGAEGVVGRYFHHKAVTSGKQQRDLKGLRACGYRTTYAMLQAYSTRSTPSSHPTRSACSPSRA